MKNYEGISFSGGSKVMVKVFGLYTNNRKLPRNGDRSPAVQPCKKNFPSTSAWPTKTCPEAIAVAGINDPSIADLRKGFNSKNSAGGLGSKATSSSNKFSTHPLSSKKKW